MSMLRKAYSVVGALLILEYLGQFYLIASAIFTLIAHAGESKSSKVIYSAFKDGDAIASLHVINGQVVIPLTTVVLIALAFASRLPRRTIGLTALLLILAGVQWGLVLIGVPVVAGLHGLNAVVIVALGVWLMWSNWAWRRQPTQGAPEVEGGQGELQRESPGHADRAFGNL